MTAAGRSVLERVRQASPGASALAGAAVGVLTGVLVGRETGKRGNEVVGDVAVHLLNRIELLTIRLRVRQAPRGGPAEIDVHRVQHGVSSRSSSDD
jgi:hypothetical protein